MWARITVYSELLWIACIASRNPRSKQGNGWSSELGVSRKGYFAPVATYLPLGTPPDILGQPTGSFETLDYWLERDVRLWKQYTNGSDKK